MFGLGAPELIIISLVVIIPGIFYLLTLQKVLSLCSPGSRTMKPQLVWLLLIPLFNIVWHFIVVNAISVSLRNEFTKRGMSESPTPGRGVGLAMCILLAAGFVIPIFRAPAALASLICWIVYWVKIAGYSAKLRQTPDEIAVQPPAEPDHH